MYNEHDPVTSRHKIILDGLTCSQNQSVKFRNILFNYFNEKNSFFFFLKFGNLNLYSLLQLDIE